MKIDTNLYLCSPCGPCGGKKFESSILVGQKFATKKLCEEAEKKNPPLLKPKK